MQSLLTRFFRSLFWTVAASVMLQGSTFLAQLCVARLLARDAFGGFAMTATTVATAVNLGQLALTLTATKFVAEWHRSAPERCGRAVALFGLVAWGMGAATALALALAAPLLAERALASPELAAVLRLGALAAMFGIFNGYQLGVLAGLQRYRSSAVAGIAPAAVSVAATALGAWSLGLWGAAGGLVLGAGLRWICYAIAMRRALAAAGIALSYRNAPEERGTVLGFALPAALSGLSQMPSVWFASALLVRAPDGLAQFALYSAALALRTMLMLLPNLSGGVATSLLNGRQGVGDAGGAARVFRLNLALTLGSTALGGAVLWLGAPLFLGLYGGAYAAEGAALLGIMVLSALLETFVIALKQILIGKSRMMLSWVALGLPRDIALVLAALVLVPAHGAEGLAAALLVAWAAALAGLGIAMLHLRRQPAEAPSVAPPLREAAS